MNCLFSSLIHFKLVTEYRANEPNTVKILSNYEIHIMPIVNPGKK